VHPPRPMDICFGTFSYFMCVASHILFFVMESRTLEDTKSGLQTRGSMIYDRLESDECVRSEPHGTPRPLRVTWDHTLAEEIVYVQCALPVFKFNIYGNCSECCRYRSMHTGGVFFFLSDDIWFQNTWSRSKFSHYARVLRNRTSNCSALRRHSHMRGYLNFHETLRIFRLRLHKEHERCV
jgi:hypothetical protein